MEWQKISETDFERFKILKSLKNFNCGDNSK
jgi:hypothetical protein